MKPDLNSKSHSVIHSSLNYQNEEATLASYSHTADVLEERTRFSMLLVHVRNVRQGCLFMEALMANPYQVLSYSFLSDIDKWIWYFTPFTSAQEEDHHIKRKMPGDVTLPCSTFVIW